MLLSYDLGIKVQHWSCLFVSPDFDTALALDYEIVNERGYQYVNAKGGCPMNPVSQMQNEAQARFSTESLKYVIL